MLVNQVIGQYIMIISRTLCNVIYMQNNTVKGLVSRNNNITVMEVRLVQQMGFIKLEAHSFVTFLSSNQGPQNLNQGIISVLSLSHIAHCLTKKSLKIPKW
jgi:uncharacterized protein (DUF2164 family)